MGELIVPLLRKKWRARARIGVNCALAQEKVESKGTIIVPVSRRGTWNRGSPSMPENEKK
jgi:hypothetical protein